MTKRNTRRRPMATCFSILFFTNVLYSSVILINLFTRTFCFRSDPIRFSKNGGGHQQSFYLLPAYADGSDYPRFSERHCML